MTTDVPVSGSGQHDVAIIGAGLSGLVAAHRLVEAEVTDVVVLEASDRVGGRALSHRLADGTTLDVGGQWAARAHTRLLALAAEMGVPTFPTYYRGGTCWSPGVSATATAKPRRRGRHLWA